MEDNFLRRRKVQQRTGLAKSTLYTQIKAGTFPKPVKIGDRAVGWVESEVAEWQRQRIAKARKS